MSGQTTRSQGSQGFYIQVNRLCVCLHLYYKTYFLVSAYELHSSGLIQALLKMFAVESKNRKSSKLQRQRVDIFRKVFCTKPGEDIATGIKI